MATKKDGSTSKVSFGLENTVPPPQISSSDATT